MAISKLISLLVGLIYGTMFVNAHSWMSCPNSFWPGVQRGVELNGPCEGLQQNTPTTYVKAGERLKVGWVSNNHAGGYVRLSLVPWSSRENSQVYKENVLKGACYGFDETIDSAMLARGECHHPCNARPGCEWQSDVNDIHRFDTTIAIPYNLADGDYVLQWVALVGSIDFPYYSCARLSVSGGNPQMGSCQRSGQAKKYQCSKSGSGSAEGVIFDGTKAGDFCFSPTGLGDIDSTIAEKPVNHDCDPRVSCELAYRFDECAITLNGIANTEDPKQTCSADVSEGNGGLGDGSDSGSGTDGGNGGGHGGHGGHGGTGSGDDPSDLSKEGSPCTVLDPMLCHECDISVCENDKRRLYSCVANTRCKQVQEGYAYCEFDLHDECHKQQQQ
eukprot:Nk52_evm13s2171 gene=Nk52_evmTU13s2171